MIDPNMISALMEKSYSKLKTASLVLQAGQYDDAVSRAYYAVFNAITALLYKKGRVYSSHGQVIGAFNRDFVKSGIFPSDFTRKINGLFEDRQAGDYDPSPAIISEVAERHLENAEIIVAAIRKLIEKDM